MSQEQVTELFYTGIGSRKISPAMFHQMRRIGQLAAEKGWTLRSGGADGSDSAFEVGAGFGHGETKIFLPWKGFNDNKSPLFGVGPQALQIAGEIHPHWRFMKDSVRALMARNVYQILGYRLDKPTKFVVCWTPDGCEWHTRYDPEKTGGTGLAIALASMKSIPVYNLFNKGRLEKVYQLLGEEVDCVDGRRNGNGTGL